MSEDKDVTIEVEVPQNSEEVTNDSAAPETEPETISEEDDSLSESKEKSKKSNWKKMSAKVKKLERQNQELARRLEDQETEDDDTDITETSDTDDMRLELARIKFFQENPSATKFRVGIDEFLGKYPDGDLDDALAWAKTKYSTSRSRSDMSLKTTTTKTVKMSELSEEEALKKLSNKDYLEYQRLKGQVE